MTLCAALIVSSTAFAQQYPNRPVKIIVPFAPSVSTDIVARLIAPNLSATLKPQFAL